MVGQNYLGFELLADEVLVVSTLLWLRVVCMFTHLIRRIDFILASGCANASSSSYRLGNGTLGFGAASCDAFSFLFCDGMFGGGSNNAAADLQGFGGGGGSNARHCCCSFILVVPATALLLQFRFGGGSNGAAAAVLFWWWQQRRCCCSFVWLWRQIASTNNMLRENNTIVYGMQNPRVTGTWLGN